MDQLPALDPSKIFPTFVGSNELSPFHHCYANNQTVLRIAAGRSFAHYNGDDPEVGYWALCKQAALYDVPECPVEVTCPGATKFLEKVLTRRVADMRVGQGRYMLACAFNGGLFMDGILFRLGEARFWFVQPDGDLNTWLLAHQDGFDISVSDPRSRALQLQGPKSFEIMQAASDGEIDASLGYFHSRFCRIGGQEVYVSRTGWTGELGYEIYTQGTQTDCPRLWDHLMAAGAPRGMVFSSMQSMNIRRIEAGILDSGGDFDSSMMPFEAGLGKFVDLSKERFIGREALSNAPRAKRLYGFRCGDLIPASGDAIFDDDIQVGKVTTGGRSPYLKCGIGYVRFEPAGDWPGTTLSLRRGNQCSQVVEIVDLPFYDSGKHILRGDVEQA